MIVDYVVVTMGNLLCEKIGNKFSVGFAIFNDHINDSSLIV